MLQGIIFDMDGVVIDSHPVHKLAWRRFLGSLGRQVTDEELDFVLDGRKKKSCATSSATSPMNKSSATAISRR